jgi:hypothetical protein
MTNPPESTAVLDPPVAAADGLVIDPEFAKLIPPLAADELAKLGDEVVAAGRCHVALAVWKGHHTVLDGHNRLRICRKHGLPYAVREEDLPDREAAKDWIIRNQMARRNLSPAAAASLRGRRYLRERQAHGGDRKGPGSKGQSDPLIAEGPGSRGQSDPLKKTADRLAEEYKVAPCTIKADLRKLVAGCGGTRPGPSRFRVPDREELP